MLKVNNFIRINKIREHTRLYISIGFGQWDAFHMCVSECMCCFFFRRSFKLVWVGGWISDCMSHNVCLVCDCCRFVICLFIYSIFVVIEICRFVAWCCYCMFVYWFYYSSSSSLLCWFYVASVATMIFSSVFANDRYDSTNPQKWVDKLYWKYQFEWTINQVYFLSCVDVWASGNVTTVWSHGFPLQILLENGKHCLRILFFLFFDMLLTYLF